MILLLLLVLLLLLLLSFSFISIFTLCVVGAALLLELGIDGLFTCNNNDADEEDRFRSGDGDSEGEIDLADEFMDDWGDVEIDELAATVVEDNDG